MFHNIQKRKISFVISCILLFGSISFSGIADEKEKLSSVYGGGKATFSQMNLISEEASISDLPLRNASTSDIPENDGKALELIEDIVLNDPSTGVEVWIPAFFYEDHMSIRVKPIQEKELGEYLTQIETDRKDVLSAYDISIIDKKSREEIQPNVEVKVKIPTEAGGLEKKVIRMDTEESFTELTVEEVSNDAITVITDHFTPYITIAGESGDVEGYLIFRYLDEEGRDIIRPKIELPVDTQYIGQSYYIGGEDKLYIEGYIYQKTSFRGEVGDSEDDNGSFTEFTVESNDTREELIFHYKKADKFDFAGFTLQNQTISKDYSGTQITLEERRTDGATLVKSVVCETYEGVNQYKYEYYFADMDGSVKRINEDGYIAEEIADYFSDNKLPFKVGDSFALEELNAVRTRTRNYDQPSTFFLDYLEKDGLKIEFTHESYDPDNQFRLNYERIYSSLKYRVTVDLSTGAIMKIEQMSGDKEDPYLRPSFATDVYEEIKIHSMELHNGTDTLEDMFGMYERDEIYDSKHLRIGYFTDESYYFQYYIERFDLITLDMYLTDTNIYREFVVEDQIIYTYDNGKLFDAQIFFDDEEFRKMVMEENRKYALDSAVSLLQSEEWLHEIKTNPEAKKYKELSIGTNKDSRDGRRTIDFGTYVNPDLYGEFEALSLRSDRGVYLYRQEGVGHFIADEEDEIIGFHLPVGKGIRGGWLMKRKHKEVIISKKDSETGKELSGAKLRVINSDGAIVEEWVSDGTLHTIYDLKDGGYTLIEVSPPSAYQKAEDVLFTVKKGVVDSGTVVMYDRPIVPRETKPDESEVEKEKESKPEKETESEPEKESEPKKETESELEKETKSKESELFNGVVLGENMNLQGGKTVYKRDLKTYDFNLISICTVLFLASLSALGMMIVRQRAKRDEGMS